jgi:hypothetical protein
MPAIPQSPCSYQVKGFTPSPISKIPISKIPIPKIPIPKIPIPKILS